MKINNKHFGANPLIFERAQQLRLRMTKAEKLLWEELRGKKLGGYKFRNQHPISKYILDFYCVKKKLGIEIDGSVHDDQAQQFYDEDRSNNLKELGLSIIRFRNSDIFTDIENVKQQILTNLNNDIN